MITKEEFLKNTNDDELFSVVESFLNRWKKRFKSENPNRRRIKMKTYNYIADMGSIKILLRDGSIFFGNDYGDGEFKVNVCQEDELPKEHKFLGHFTIFTKGYLMYSDCDNHGEQHKFSKGRYFVCLDKDGTTFYIYKIDEDLNA